MGKAEENKKKKYESLLNTAFELFTAKGLNNTSISDIVERAGVAKGTFYLYFKDKYDIRSRIIVHRASKLFAEAHEALLKEDMDDFTDKLVFIVNHCLKNNRSKAFVLSHFHGFSMITSRLHLSTI